VDENLDGHSFVDILLAAAIPVTRCRDLSFGGVEDKSWIPQVSKMGLIIVTADVRTRFRPAEKQALIAARARVIHLRLGNRATHADLAQNFVRTRIDIERFIKRNLAPWVVTLTRPTTTASGRAIQAGRLNRIMLGD